MGVDAALQLEKIGTNSVGVERTSIILRFFKIFWCSKKEEE